MAVEVGKQPGPGSAYLAAVEYPFPPRSAEVAVHDSFCQVVAPG